MPISLRLPSGTFGGREREGDDQALPLQWLVSRSQDNPNGSARRSRCRFRLAWTMDNTYRLCRGKALLRSGSASSGIQRG
jgi:hypothetical protein